MTLQFGESLAVVTAVPRWCLYFVGLRVGYMHKHLSIELTPILVGFCVIKTLRFDLLSGHVRLYLCPFFPCCLAHILHPQGMCIGSLSTFTANQ